MPVGAEYDIIMQIIQDRSKGMIKHSYKKLGLFAFVVVLVLSSMLPVLAEKTAGEQAEQSAQTTEEKIRQTVQSIDELRTQTEEAKKKLESATEEKNLLDKKMKELNGQLEEVQLALVDVETRIDQKNEEIRFTREELIQMEETRQERYESMKVRIRFMYEHSSNNMIESLLSAHSMSEILNRAEYFSQVVAYDREQLRQYQALMKQLEAKKGQFEAQKGELVALRQEQQAQMDKLGVLIEQTRTDLKSAGILVASVEDTLDKLDDKLQKQLDYEAALELQKAAEDQARLDEIRRQEEELRRQQEEERRRRQEEEERRKQQEADGQKDAEDTIFPVDDSEETQVTVTSENLELLAAIIQCEADGEPYEGKLAVGSVVMNRVHSSSFPNTVMGVIYQAGQFSPVASGRFATRLAAGSNATCRQAAREVLNGNITVPYLYFRVDNGTIDGYVLGHHVFY